MPHLRIIFMGTPEFALPFLDKLFNEKNFEISAVVTQEDKKVGRKQELMAPPIKNLALEYQIPILQPKSIRKNPGFMKLLKSLEPDFIVVVAYGKMLPKEILEIPRYGCINVHGSLLPKYRGASPIETALLQGEKETGLTIMKMAEKLDSGDVYLLKRIPIEKQDNSLSLRLKLSLLGASLLPETLKAIKEGTLTALPQDEAKATYCQKIEKEDGLINLHDFTAEEIERKIRAYTPWPSCYIMVKGKRLKILEAEIDTDKRIPTGTAIDLDKDRIGLGTKKGLLIPTKVQLEGKSALTIKQFLAGNRGLFAQ